MLDQLVESKSNSVENSRRTKFLAGIGALAIFTLLTMWTVSLFGKDFGMGGDDLSLTTLVAPVPVPDEEPPPEVKKENEPKPEVAVRTELFARTEDSTKIPDVTDNTKPVKAIPKYGDFAKGAENSDPANQGATNAGRETTQGTGKGLGDSGNDKPASTESEGEPPPVVKKAPPRTVSGGVLNGKATSLPKPAYPPAARAVHASGAVSVQVLIDEGGRVVSASAVSGHPLLRQAAEGAARGARFSPTLLSGQPVKVSGVITYNFVP